MRGTATPRRRGFPALSWAWPPEGHRQLLRAAICPDIDLAEAELRSWLRENDLDRANFSEHRLLSAVTGRLGARLNALPEYPRLTGIQRMNWTRSRLAVAEVRPALLRMVTSGLRVVLLKGAARIALDTAEQKVRTAWDVDILVRDSDFAIAYGLLSVDGWQSARGESQLGLASRLSHVRARNLKKGRFGDIDLHRIAYRPEHQSTPDDARLYSDARAVTYFGIDCFVPSPEERLSMAIANGGLDGESHSDWIVDCAKIIECDSVDWPALEAIIDRRGLTGHAEIAISFLRHGLGLSAQLPKGFLSDRRSGWIRPRDIGSLLLAKHPSEMARPLQLVRRTIVETRKLKASRDQRTAACPLFVARMRNVAASGDGGAALRVPLDRDPTTVGPHILRLELMVMTSRQRRRTDFELVSEGRSICQMRGVRLRPQEGGKRLRFKGTVLLDPADGPLFIDALPGRYLEQDAPEEMQARYAALPFVVLHATLTRFRAR